MPETEGSQENIAYIRTHVDKIERLVRLDLAANPRSRAYIEETFAAKKHSAKIYLALSGNPKTQEELRALTKMSAANVSKICTHLEERELIQKVRRRKQLYFSWTEAERVLRVSSIAKKLTDH